MRCGSLAITGLFVLRICSTAAQSGAAHPPVTGRPAVQKPPGATPAAPVPPDDMTEEQKTIYALGLSIYHSLDPFHLSPAELELVKRGMSDAAAGKPAVELRGRGQQIEELQNERTAHAATAQKAASQAYLEKAATQPGAVRTDSGLVYREVQPGTGSSPKAADTVTVNYRGTLIDGTEFDNSYKSNQPAEFPLTGVIPCWTEGLQKMKVGGKSVLVCPSDLAYGDSGRPPIPGGAALIFEIELLKITPAVP